MMRLRPIFFSFLLISCICLWLASAWAEQATEQETESLLLSQEERQRRLLQTTMTGVGLVTLWGVLQWDYFSRWPHCESEGWFGKDTDSGGADKLGHVYSSYAFSHALSNLYEYWGFTTNNAALYGAFSSFAIMSYMELGDAFSNYGSSYEDLLSNTAGALLGYVLYKNKDLASKIDFRWEYSFKANKTDFSTDYENSKFLLALKFNGFEATKQTFLRHLEFHLGYYTRGFSSKEVHNERNIYVGIGLNLTDLLYRHSWKKTATALRYIQLPYTSITASQNID